MKRSCLVFLVLVAVWLLVPPSAAQARDRHTFHLVEATIDDIQDAFRSGLLSPEELVRMYLARIAAYDQGSPQLNSYLHVNEHAIDAARDLNAYLASLGSSAPVHTLADVIAYNSAHASLALKYGQVLAIAADSLDTSSGSADSIRYQNDREKDLDIARDRGLNVIFNGPDGVRGTDDDFDAILFPANRGANIAARAGYPSIVVPAGFVPNPAVPPPPLPEPPPFPEGFDAKDSPVGVTFTGPAFSEPRLIGLAYAFEQATQHRRPPDSAPPLPADVVRKH
jgi:hypothetical protein